MENHLNFLKDILRFAHNNTDATFVAMDQDNTPLVMTLKTGVINYISYKHKKNQSAIFLLENLRITDYCIKNYLKFNSKPVDLPSTNEIIKLLTAQLPESFEYYQGQLFSLNNSSISEETKLVSPINPELNLIPKNALQIVSSSLHKSLGPISKMIYEDVLSQFPSILTRKDLADLVNLIMEEIEDEEIEYQKEFLTSISEKLGNILTVVIPQS